MIFSSKDSEQMKSFIVQFKVAFNFNETNNNMSSIDFPPQYNLEVMCYNPSIFISARLMLSKHCFVNSMIISSPKLNLHISILSSLHKLEPNIIHYFTRP